MSDLNLGSLKLPLNSATKTFAILAKRGAGKTYTADVMAEEFFKNNIPFIIIDPIDVHWGLRFAANGRDKGLPVVVFGVEHADIQLTRDMGRQIAQAVVKENVSCIISTFGLPKTAQRHLVSEFAEELLNINNSPRHVFIEEAHEFCLSSDTELLTKEGWKKYTEINNKTVAVAFDLKKQKYCYQRVKRIIIRRHDGDMICFKSDGIDCLCTPDHRVVLQRFQHDPKRYKIYDPAFCNASKMPQQFFVPKGGSPIGKGIKNLSEEICKILGWVITDGNFHEKDKNYIAVSQSSGTVKRGVKIEAEMMAVLKKYGATISKRRRVSQLPNGKFYSSIVTRFYLGKKFSDFLVTWLGRDIHRIPRVILENGSQKQLFSLFEGLMQGDGCASGGYKNNWRTFTSGSVTKAGLSDDMQELCLKLGQSASKVTKGSVDILHLSKRLHHYIRKYGHENFSGIVWDITLPSGAFVARRNGKVFVTGNCPQRVSGDLGKVFNNVSNLVVMGRNRGIGVTLINQRAATINKDVLTQIDSLLAFRNVAPQDRKALQEWVEYHSAKGDFKKFMDSLPSLPTGTGWIWSPEFLNKFEKIKIRKRETFHPDREKLGVNFEMPKLTQADIQSFIEKFSQSVQKPEPAVKGKIQPIVGISEAIKIRNEYESKLIEKDSEIRRLQAIMMNVQNAVGLGGNAVLPVTGGSNLQLWLNKLGKGHANILKFLADNSGRKFTRNQLALGVGMQNSGTFRAYVGLLKRNKLISEDDGGIRVNPDAL